MGHLRLSLCSMQSSHVNLTSALQLRELPRCLLPCLEMLQAPCFNQPCLKQDLYMIHRWYKSLGKSHISQSSLSRGVIPLIHHRCSSSIKAQAAQINLLFRPSVMLARCNSEQKSDVLFPDVMELRFWSRDSSHLFTHSCQNTSG